jgi:exopolysaccharide production protein ExoZ
MLAIDVYFKGSASRGMLYFANFGGVGVHLFFVISGFIMVYASFGGQLTLFQPSMFLFRRFCRIYPIYWIYAAAYLLLHQSILQSYSLSSGDVLGSLLLLPGYSHLIIGPGWTLSFEVYFYICFGLFMSLGLVRGLSAMTLFFLGSIVIGSIFYFNNAAFHVATDTLLVEFLAGAWIANLFLARIHVSAKMSNLLIALACAGFAGGFAYGYHRLPSLLMWGLPSALLITGLVFKERIGQFAGFFQRLSFLGDSSYSLYLLHILLIDLFFKAYLTMFSDPGFGYVAMCLVFTVLCIIIAFVLYELIERRIVRTLQGITKNLLGPKLVKRATQAE